MYLSSVLGRTSAELEKVGDPERSIKKFLEQTPYISTYPERNKKSKRRAR